MKRFRDRKIRFAAYTLYMLLIVMTAGGCHAGGEKEDKSSKNESAAESTDKSETDVDKVIKDDGGEVMETAEDDNAIQPATDALGAIQLFYQGYNEHNTDYMKMATLDGAEGEMLAVMGSDEEEYWENHDEDQGSWFGVGVFTSYDIEAEVNKPVADLEALQNSLASEYGFEGTVEEACEIDFNRIIHGTEGTVTKKNNYALVVKVNGYWYIVKRELS